MLHSMNRPDTHDVVVPVGLVKSGRLWLKSFECCVFMLSFGGVTSLLLLYDSCDALVA